MHGLHGLALYLSIGTAGTVVLTLAFYGLHRRMQRHKRVQIQANIRQLALLRALIAGFQRHRGLSNGLLCGDASMGQDLGDTRRQLDQHIREAQALGGSHRDAWNGLIDHWSRLRQGASAPRRTT
ncbi:hypothetical protein I0E51_01165 [Pseudomonas lalucatii]|nr:hypothetical protein [Pseudomonas lalucatii]